MQAIVSVLHTVSEARSHWEESLGGAHVMLNLHEDNAHEFKISPTLQLLLLEGQPVRGEAKFCRMHTTAS